MKGCLVAYPASGGFWPSWAKMHAVGAGRVYYCAEREIAPDTRVYVPNAHQINTAYREGTISQHFLYGVMRDPHWANIQSPAALAAAAHQDVIDAGADKSTCPYLFDIEFTHDPHWIAETIREWRKLRPTRLTAWTMEPYQGGWFNKELVDRINNDPNLVVVPQNFYSKMEPADGTAGLRLRGDIISRGVKPSRVKMFYDGAKAIPPDWDGIIFSEERLSNPALAPARAGSHLG